MRAGYVGNTALQERLHRSPTEARAIVEAVVTENADVKETKDDWTGLDSLTGLFLPDIAGVRLAQDTDATHATHDTSSSNQENTVTDLDNQDPMFFLELEWSEIDAPDFEIHEFTATLDPDVDGNGRDVAEFRCQLFRVAKEGEEWSELQAISPRASKSVTGNSQADFTFEFTGSLVGEEPKTGDSPESEGDYDAGTNPKTWVLIWAVTSDGSPAGNVAWVGDNDDSASSTLVADGGGTNVAQARLHKVDRVNDAREINVGGRFDRLSFGDGIPDFTMAGQTYSSATATFSGNGNEIDLGSSPLSDTDLVVVAQGEEPSDSSLTWEVYNGSSWVECVDGDVIGEDNTDDGGKDLSGVPRQQTYHMRVTLDPSSDGHTSPFARRLGVEEVTTTDLDETADVASAGNWSFDPVTLRGEIPEATIRLLKDGVRDYRSEGERIFATHHIDDVDFRVWIGHPDLDRTHWLHVDTFEVDDYSSEGEAIEVTCLSPTRRLKTGVPPYDAAANERVPTEYTNSTLKSAWDDLLDSQVSLPARYRGPGVEDTTSQSVSKTIRDSDGKTELDAIAHLAGGTVVPSQGRVKYQPAFAEGGTRVAFPMQETTVKGVTPGYKNRVDEYFVNYAYDRDAEQFSGEVRSFHAPSITKLGEGSLDAPEELYEEAARWLPTPNDTSSKAADQNLAAHVAHRTTDEIGPGLKQIRFDSHVPHPELEPGDTVAVQTDQLVLKSPDTDQAYRGVLWLVGVVQAQHDVMGRELTVWIQKIADAIPGEEDAPRKNFDTPSFEDVSVAVLDDGTVKVEVLGDSVTQSIDAAVDFDGDSTTDETLTASGTSMSQTTSGTVAKGGSGTVTVTLYAQTGQSGNSRSKDAPISRPGEQTAADVNPTVEIDPDTANTTLYTSTQYDVTATAGDDVSSPSLEVRTAVVYGDQSISWSSWTSSPKTISVSALPKIQQTLYAQARDTSLSGNPTSDVASIAVEGQFEGLDEGDGGRLDPGVVPGGSYSPPTGAGKPVVRRLLDQIYGGPQNLLGPDAGPEKSGTGTFPGSPANVTPSEIDKEPGDTLSASVKVRSETGADTLRAEIRYRDSSDTIIRTDQGTTRTDASYGLVVVEDSEIPTGTAEINVFVRNMDTTETGYAKQYMLNEGPVAQSFVHPGIRTHRETAADLYRSASRTDALQDIVQKLKATGDADVGMQIGGFAFNSHTEQRTGRNGDSPTFNNDYQAAPKVHFVPQRAVSQINGVSSDVKQKMVATNPSVSGFDLDAVAEYGATTTTDHDDGFSSSRNASAPENGSASITADGDAIYSNLEDADGTANDFTVTYDIDATGLVGQFAQVTVHVEYSDAATGGNWTSAAANVYAKGQNLTDEQVNFTASLSGDYDIRLRLTYSDASESGNATLTGHGEDGTPPGVQFSVNDSTLTTETMTPNSTDKVYWEAKEVSAA